jgi:hypothetical protein
MARELGAKGVVFCVFDSGAEMVYVAVAFLLTLLAACLVLVMASPQGSRFVYMFQAYVFPRYRDGFVPFPAGYSLEELV